MNYTTCGKENLFQSILDTLDGFRFTADSFPEGFVA
jgi:hypothetical protein